MVRIGSDLTLLNETALDHIDPLLNAVLRTGEVVNTPIGETIFVADAESLVISDVNELVLTPFQNSDGSGQSVSIVLPDASTKTISYDETTNAVVSESTNFAVGTYFVVGGLKVNVKEI